MLPLGADVCWLQSHVAGVHETSLANNCPLSPTTTRPRRTKAGCTQQAEGARRNMNQRPGQRQQKPRTACGTLIVAY